MVRLVPGACVTDSKGLHDKMHHTVIAPKGDKWRRVDIECWALKEGLETSSTKFFFLYIVEHNWITVEEWTTLESDTRFMSSKKRGTAGISTQETPSFEDLNVEGPSRDGTTHVCVHCTRTSTEHPGHSSRVSSSTHFFLQERAGSFSGLE